MNEQRKRMLIIEDETNLARFLQLEFEHEQMDVETTADGNEGLQRALDEAWDIILLDVMLPGISGMEVCRRIRAKKRTPIIMLTARDTVPDRVSGLDAGADDYLTKPFAIEELFARVRAVMRRQHDDAPERTVIEVQSCLLYPEERRVICNEKPLDLTTREFDLLHYLLRNVNRVLNRETILKNVWSYDYMGDTNVVDVYVRYLRSKLAEVEMGDLIETVRGVGYVIREDQHAD